MLHCIVFPLLFLCGSSSGLLHLYDLGVVCDIFPEIVATLSFTGTILAACLMLKGYYFPSTKDAGTTGDRFKDFMFGTELYPKILGIDVKHFLHCRFSMTFWMI